MTCKIFYEPAISTLWSYQTSLIPLVRCLPSNAYVDKKKTKRSTSMGLSRDLLPSDFDRVRFYAQKIKVLNTLHPFPPSHVYTLNAHVFAMILLHKPKYEPFLPNLCRLTLTESAFYGEAIIPRLIVGPSLKSVCVWLEESVFGTSWDNIQLILSPFVSSLKSFSIGHDDYDELFNCGSSLHLIQLYSNFHDLTLFRTRKVKLDHHTLIHISTLPFLTELDLDLDDIDCSAIPELSFRRLTNLRLVTTCLDNVTLFVSSTSFKALQTIYIERDWMHNVEKQWNFGTFSEVLRKHHRNCPLTSITLCASTSYLDMEEITETPIKNTDIQPLFAFPHISTLALESCSTLDLDDSLLMEMSKAWPKLRTLQIEDVKLYDCQHPKLTSVGVISFARLCPDLENLKLCFDAWDVPKYTSYNALARSSTSSSRLKQLDVCRSRILEAEHLSESLILAFPNLQEFRFRRSCPDGDPETDGFWAEEWKKVASDIQKIINWRRSHPK